MGLFAKQKADFQGRRAYVAHVKGNQLSDAGKTNEARAMHEKALALYAQAIDEGGNRRISYVMAYGVLLLRMREFTKAHDMFIRAEKTPGITKPERKQLRVNFAICQWKLGELDSAIEQLQIASHDGATSMIYGALGFMLIERGERDGDYSEAISFNQKAYDYDEDDAVVLDNLGQLNLKLGERDKALAHFKRAHEIKPRQVDTLYFLAKLTAEDGDKEAAREYIGSALEGNFSALSTITREQAQALRDELD